VWLTALMTYTHLALDDDDDDVAHDNAYVAVIMAWLLQEFTLQFI